MIARLERLKSRHKRSLLLTDANQMCNDCDLLELRVHISALEVRSE